MKRFSIVVFVLMLASCAEAPDHGSPESAMPALFRHQEPNPGQTPFGFIEKGLSKENVTEMLGNPHHTSAVGTTDIWYYFFDDANRISIYFVKDKVLRVENRKETGSGE